MATGNDDDLVRMPSRTLLVERQKEADRKANSKTTTVTLRIPTELNEWLDEYRHLSYPQRIEKQSLVIEALRLLYMARGQPGTEAYNLEDVLLTKGPGRNLGKSKRK
jgi:hypothetical protein